jgi:hypothetical protein
MEWDITLLQPWMAKLNIATMALLGVETVAPSSLAYGSRLIRSISRTIVHETPGGRPAEGQGSVSRLVSAINVARPTLAVQSPVWH